MTDDNRRIGRDMDDRLRRVEIALGKVEQRVEDHEGDIHRFAGLPTELSEIRWGQGKMQESLDAAHGAIRVLDSRLDKEHEERLQSQIDRKRELAEAKEARDAEIALEREKNEARYMELQAESAKSKQQTRQLLLGLLGMFITSAGAVLAALLSGGTP